jgi:hypothetical protein
LVVAFEVKKTPARKQRLVVGSLNKHSLGMNYL